MATASFASLNRYIRTICPEGDAALLARFARGGDEAAFAELVRRHGPAVLGVCRRVLSDAHAAEDAFQATFLLLARKAGSLHNPERLGCWLHGVARRTALKLRTRLTRRLQRERPFDETAISSRAPADADLGPALDAAIEQLPRKYRLPVVLCYLQGLTNTQAAAALGCPANTVATRLARARQRLRGRLQKEGLTTAVSAALVAATARNAAALAAGATGVPPEILTLMEGVRTAMLWKKLKLAFAAVAIVTLTGLGATRLGFRAAADQPAPGVAPPAAATSTGPTTAAAPARADENPRIPPVNLNTLDTKTRNFIVNGVDHLIGHQIAEVAEWMRASFATQWLGKELPDWPRRCRIEVTINGGPAAANTTFEFGKEFRIGGMKLAGTREQILMSLPHEVTHTILADHFRRPIPRWADEGAATLAEMRDSQRQYDRQCRQLLAAGQAMRLGHLFRLTDYPKDVVALLAQSHSVARFLVERKDRPTFLAFVAAGMKDGWEEAVKQVYGFRSVDELEEAWIASLRPQPAPPAAGVLGNPVATPPPAALPTGPLVTPQPRPLSPTAIAPPSADRDRPVPMPQLTSPYPSVLAPGGGYILAEASVDNSGGMVILKLPKGTLYEPVELHRHVNGKARSINSYVRKTIQEERFYPAEHLQFTAADGKPVSMKDLLRRLTSPTPVLVQLTEGPVDARLLKLLKDGAFVVSIESSSSANGTTPPSALR